MLVVVDSGARWRGEDAQIIYWARTDVEVGEISLPIETDRRIEQIKTEYLTWVRTLGDTRIEGSALKDKIMLSGGLSLWWMTLIAEKSPMKSPAIWQVFKLRALESVAAEMGELTLTYCGANPVLAGILRRWWDVTGRSFTWSRRGRRPPVDFHVSLGRRVSRFPHRVQALLWLVHRWWTCWRPVRRRRTEPARGPTLVTYVPNLDLDALEEGRFRSRYWEGLHDVLADRPGGVNWVWMYTPTKQASLRDMVRFRDRCNRAGGEDRFFMLEEFLPRRPVWKALRRFWRLSRAGRRVAVATTRFRLGDSRIDFYPLMAHDWACSLSGIAAMEAVTHAMIFERMARRLPARPWGCYLWENQPWEQVLVAAWRRDPRARVIANEHDVLKPLNLRLFADPQTYEESGPSAPPLPQVLAVNGAHAQGHLARSGFPAKRLIPAEALRYGALAEASRKGADETGGALLVVTGYLEAETRFQLRLVVAAAARPGVLAPFRNVVIKEHPFLPVEPILQRMKLDFKYQLTDWSLGDLWPTCAVAVLANSTGAVLDAAFAGIPVVVCAAYDGFDFSPLRGMGGGPKVANGRELAEALRSPRWIEVPDEFFYLDPELTRWRKLIAALDKIAERNDKEEEPA